MKGTIVRIYEQKKFGFIRALDSNEEYFFHKTGIAQDSDYQFEQLQMGQVVEFVPTRTPKGSRAENVTTFLD